MSSTSKIRRQDQHLIQIVDASLADSTLRAGEHLVCRPGCTPCCHGAFAINALDALRLRTAMANLAETNPTQAEAIAARARGFLSEHGESFPGDKTTGILGTSESDQENFEDFVNEAPCPVLNPETGFCDLYDARPMTCRVFGPPVRSFGEATEETGQEGFAICELCFTHATPEEIAAAEMRVPHEIERQVLAQLATSEGASPQTLGETIIAYCLTPPKAARQPPS
jgi:Fe-S-cluster containining protein